MKFQDLLLHVVASLIAAGEQKKLRDNFIHALAFLFDCLQTLPAVTVLHTASQILGAGGNDSYRSAQFVGGV